MDIALTLLIKLIPLYALIALGYAASKYTEAKKESIAALLIYIIAPVVIFQGVTSATLDVGMLSLPVLFFAIGTLFSLTFLWIGSFMWKDATKNALAFSAGTGNTGYFGLPVALMIFSEDVLGIVVLSTLGLVLFENSVGFFLAARGHHTIRESVVKVAKLPTIYAFIIGVLINISQVDLGETYESIAISFRGAYTVLGMMIIGMGIAGMKGFKPDAPFLLLGFFAKFVCWPLIILAVIAIDRTYLHLYTPDIHKVMILLSCVPFAANSVTIAAQLRAQPEKAAFAVVISMLFALIYIPVVVTLFLR